MFLYLSNQSNDQHVDGCRLALTHENSTRYLFETEQLIDENVEAYEIIDSSGSLSKGGYVITNNLPITKEGRDIFESRFLARSKLIEKEPGFLAIRILRPLNSNTYSILTLWEDETSFKNWQHSDAYAAQHKKRGTSEGIEHQHSQIFAGPPVVTGYIAEIY